VVDAACEFQPIVDRSTRMLRLVKEAAVAYLRDTALNSDVLTNPRAVIEYCRAAMAGMKNEQVRVLYLDNRNALLADELLFQGTVGEGIAYPRKMVEEGIRLGATAAIVVHNHPTGRKSPSMQDMALTKRLLRALWLVDIRLLDHIIVGREGHCSLYETAHCIWEEFYKEREENP